MNAEPDEYELAVRARSGDAEALAALGADPERVRAEVETMQAGGW